MFQEVVKSSSVECSMPKATSSKPEEQGLFLEFIIMNMNRFTSGTKITVLFFAWVNHKKDSFLCTLMMVNFISAIVPGTFFCVVKAAASPWLQSP